MGKEYGRKTMKLVDHQLSIKDSRELPLKWSEKKRQKKKVGRVD
jgi:hypothetical protein